MRFSYYKSGKSFLYREFPFWIASLASRTLVVFVPVILVLVPGLRLIPWAYRWRGQLRIYRQYRKSAGAGTGSITAGVNNRKNERNWRTGWMKLRAWSKHMKVPASFANLF